MKKIYFLLFVFYGLALNAQTLVFQNQNLKLAMLNSANTLNQASQNISIDINFDNEIQAEEAALVYTLNLNNYGFNVLENIQYFTNLRTFDCTGNNLTTLNVDMLTNLRVLGCGNNALTSLSINGLNFLQTVGCAQNQLTSLTLANLYNGF